MYTQFPQSAEKYTPFAIDPLSSVGGENKKQGIAGLIANICLTFESLAKMTKFIEKLFRNSANLP